ncbi:MAG: hypothetical protein ACFFEK_01705 [Candidatus Thorarchaeota archaeon]
MSKTVVLTHDDLDGITSGVTLDRNDFPRFLHLLAEYIEKID